MHLTQSGCSTKNRLLSFSHLALYPRLEAARTSSGCSGLCASQYFCPGGTSALQPGCLQGTYGLYGMRPAPFSILADNNISHIQSGHLRTFPADFIFYICSTLQVLWRSSLSDSCRLYHSTYQMRVLLDICGHFRRISIIVGFSGSTTCAKALLCHLRTVLSSAIISSPILVHV